MEQIKELKQKGDSKPCASPVALNMLNRVQLLKDPTPNLDSNSGHQLAYVGDVVGTGSSRKV